MPHLHTTIPQITRDQLDELKEACGYTQSQAVMLSVQMLYDEKIRKGKAMFIKVTVSEDSLFSGWDSNDVEKFDLAASHMKFCVMLHEKIVAEFPGAEVEVVKGMMDRILTDTFEDYNYIQELQGQIYNAWEWCVKLAD